MTGEATDLAAEDLLRRLMGRDMADVGLDQSSLLHVPGGSGLAGQYQGGDAILGLLRRMVELTNATLRFGNTEVLIADDQTVVLCGRLIGSRRRKQLDTCALRILALRDHKVRDMWVFHQDQDQVDDFWKVKKGGAHGQPLKLPG